jgi:hypothetical protein
LPPTSIGLPSPYVSTGKLAYKFISPSRLIRISSHKTGEPFFGRSGANRFDAPDPALFGACYCGKSLDVAIAESVLHDEVPVNGQFKIAATTLESRYVIRFAGTKLKVADLTGASLKKLGGTADLSGTANYAITREWSRAVHQNSGNYDGFIYMSRHLNNDVAVILFDRAAPKMDMISATKLIEYDGFAYAAKKLGIVGA